MKGDIKSNIDLVDVYPAQSTAAGTVNSAAVDMANYISGAFHLQVGTVAAGGTLDAKLQHSADGTTDWTDEASGWGNDTAIVQLLAVGAVQLNVVQARRRFYRLVHTVAVAAIEYNVSGVFGPKRYVEPA